MAQHDVVVIGDLNPDIVLTGLESDAPQLGTEQFFDTIERTLGGSGALTSVTLSRLGLNSALISRIGDDEPAAFCRAFLEREGVTPLLSINPSLPTAVTIAVAYPADRLLLTSLGTIADLAAEDIPASVLAEARHVHVSSYFMQKKLQRGLAALFAAAHANGATTSLDTGWDPTGKWLDANLEAALAATDIFLPNMSELIQITGLEDPDAGAARLLTFGAGAIVVKNGARGANFYSAGEFHTDRGFTIAPLDTTGAGDAFNAGYIAASLEERSIWDRLRFANACGAVVTGVRGGAGDNLKRVDFDKMYESNR